MPLLRTLVINRDYENIDQLLTANPSLANEPLPLDENCLMLAHPLHRICDAVMNNIISDEEGAKVAKILVEHGANVNGNEQIDKQDSPLTAAASLHADDVAIVLIEHGADIHHRGCHGGTALHWAAWCGRDKLVRRLIDAGADIHRRCIDFEGTPLGWAVHGYKFGEDQNRHHQIECVRILLAAGADKNAPNGEGELPIDFLDESDTEMRSLLT